jgi:hypothetical protein
LLLLLRFSQSHWGGEKVLSLASKRGLSASFLICFGVGPITRRRIGQMHRISGATASEREDEVHDRTRSDRDGPENSGWRLPRVDNRLVVAVAFVLTCLGILIGGHLYGRYLGSFNSLVAMAISSRRNITHPRFGGDSRYKAQGIREQGSI